MRMTRRAFGALAGALVGARVAPGVRAASSSRLQRSSGRLSAHPDPTVANSVLGTVALGLDDSGRDGIIHVPGGTSRGPWPLLLLLHGAQSSGERQFARLHTLVDELGVAVLAPDSRQARWDVLRGGFGDDTDFIERALVHTFRQVPVDPGRVWIAGFSDGATCALSLGLVNGDLFRRIIAFSPGMVVVSEPFHERPPVFVSHGLDDDILPIERTSRPIVAGLRNLKYAVTLREFDGGHEVPPAVAREALTWADAPVSPGRAR